MGLATSVETSGVDLRTRTKQLGAKGKTRRKKCDVKFAGTTRNRVVQNNYVRIGVRKLLRMGLVPARVWSIEAVGIGPTERLMLRRHMAAAAGKKETVSFTSFHGGEYFEVLGGLVHCGHAFGCGRCVDGKMDKRTGEVEEADL